MANPTAMARKKRGWEDRSYDYVMYAIYGAFTFLCAYPFYYLIIGTLSNTQLVDMGKIILWPVGVHFNNYVEIFKVQNLGGAALVSVLRMVIGTGTSLLATAYMAYFFTKEDMWARKFWYRFTVVTMYFSAGLIPGYLNIKMLGLMNNFWVYIIPALISVFNMILVKTSIEAMPAELEESAHLDGAGYLRRFVQIVLPLQKPILATIALFTAVTHWNDFFTTMLYITDTKLYTLQFLLYELLNHIQTASQQIEYESSSQLAASSITPTGIRLTLTAVVTLPILVVYPFIQRFFVQGIMVGAVKG